MMPQDEGIRRRLAIRRGQVHYDAGKDTIGLEHNDFIRDFVKRSKELTDPQYNPQAKLYNVTSLIISTSAVMAIIYERIKYINSHTEEENELHRSHREIFEKFKENTFSELASGNKGSRSIFKNFAESDEWSIRYINSSGNKLKSDQVIDLAPEAKDDSKSVKSKNFFEALRNGLAHGNIITQSPNQENSSPSKSISKIIIISNWKEKYTLKGYIYIEFTIQALSVFLKDWVHYIDESYDAEFINIDVGISERRAI